MADPTQAGLFKFRSADQIRKDVNAPHPVASAAGSMFLQQGGRMMERATGLPGYAAGMRNVDAAINDRFQQKMFNSFLNREAKWAEEELQRIKAEWTGKTTPQPMPNPDNPKEKIAGVPIPGAPVDPENPYAHLVPTSSGPPAEKLLNQANQAMNTEIHRVITRLMELGQQFYKTNPYVSDYVGTMVSNHIDFIQRMTGGARQARDDSWAIRNQQMQEKKDLAMLELRGAQTDQARAQAGQARAYGQRARTDVGRTKGGLIRGPIKFDIGNPQTWMDILDHERYQKEVITVSRDLSTRALAAVTPEQRLQPGFSTEEIEDQALSEAEGLVLQNYLYKEWDKRINRPSGGGKLTDVQKRAAFDKYLQEQVGEHPVISRLRFGYTEDVAPFVSPAPMSEPAREKFADAFAERTRLSVIAGADTPELNAAVAHLNNLKKVNPTEYRPTIEAILSSLSAEIVRIEDRMAALQELEDVSKIEGDASQRAAAKQQFDELKKVNRALRKKYDNLRVRATVGLYE